MRRVMALLIRLDFSASASLPTKASRVAFSRLACSNNPGSASTMPGNLSQRSFSRTNSSKSSCFMVVLMVSTTRIARERRWVVHAEIRLAQHDAIERRVAESERCESRLEPPLVAQHVLDVLDADVARTQHCVHAGACLAGCEELGQVGQSQ